MMRRFLGALGIAVALLLMLAGMVWASGPVNQDQPGRPIIVRWSTESEVNTAGFNIYRSLRGGTYVFTDTNVIAGQSYWYELEEVELGGQVNRLERTQATAGRQGLSLPSGFPCGGALLVLPLFGLVRARVKENRVRRRVR